MTKATLDSLLLTIDDLRAKLAEAETLAEGTLRDVVIANTKLAEAEAIVVQSHCDLTTLNRSLTAAESRVAALTEALTGLAALVRGECPALLDEDSGGDARLALTIEAALSPSQDAKEARDA